MAEEAMPAGRWRGRSRPIATQKTSASSDFADGSDGLPETYCLALAFDLEKVLGGLSATQLAQLTDLRQRVEIGRLSLEAYRNWLEAFCARAARDAVGGP